MQRLFTMFPAGTAGAALFVLRVSVAVALVVGGFSHWTPLRSVWVDLGILIPTALLCFGFFTPYCAALVCFIQAFLLASAASPDRVQRLISLLDSGALAALGPGAYSIDARVFGRRIVKVPRRR